MKRKNKLYSRRKFLKQTCGAAIGLGICTWNDWLSINSATTMNSGEAGVNYGKKLSSGTGFIFDKEYLRHKLSEDYPESPQRLRSVWQRMQAIGLDKEVKNISVSGNPLSAIMAIHSESHVNLVEKEATDASICRPAVSGALRAIDSVCLGKVTNAFCALRPPGHHATNRGEYGFSFFNKVAIAARYAQ